MKLFSLYSCVRRLNIKINNNVSLQGQGDFEYVHVVLVLLRLFLTQLLKGLDCCSNQTIYPFIQLKTNNFYRI
jgi:hypothetical protein